MIGRTELWLFQIQSFTCLDSTKSILVLGLWWFE
jgi:hypothetical protein